MNLQAIIEIYAGGQGSGCQGPNCGRPASYLNNDVSSKIISVDFDNTIADHQPGTGLALGEPLPNGLAFLHALKDAGYGVRIFTARPNVSDVQNWLNNHGVGFATASNHKVQSAAYVDDRAVNWTGHQSVEEGMAQVNRMSEIRQAQVKQGMERFAQMGTK